MNIRVIPKEVGMVELLVKKVSIGISGIIYPQYNLYLSVICSLLFSVIVNYLSLPSKHTASNPNICFRWNQRI